MCPARAQIPARGSPPRFSARFSADIFLDFGNEAADVPQRIHHRDPQFRLELGAMSLEFRRAQPLTVQGYGEHPGPVVPDKFDLLLERRYPDPLRFVSFEILPPRSVLKNHRPGGGREQDLGAAGPARIAQGGLAFNKNHVGRFLPVAGKNRVLELSAHEIVYHGIQNETVFGSEHPPGLSGVDHFRLDTRLPEGIQEQFRRGAFPDGAVHSEHRHPRSTTGRDLPRPEVKFLFRFRFAKIYDPGPRGTRRPAGRLVILLPGEPGGRGESDGEEVQL